MRGDSLQDLYAKVAAVLGLGLLALSGAVVDYWPMSGPLPPIASALPRPTPGLPRPASTLAVAFTDSQVTSNAAAHRAALTTASGTVVMTSDERPSGVFAAPDAVVGVVDRSMTYEFVPAVATSVVPEIGTLASSALALPPTNATTLAAPAVATHDSAVGDESNDAGFFTSTVKRTGTSMMHAGQRTGNSIRDAVRSLGIKVRSVFPL